MDKTLQPFSIWTVFQGACLNVKAACKVFFILYIPLTLILTILFYGIFQIDETIQRSLLEIHQVSQVTILLHMSVYYVTSLLLLFLVVAYLAVILVSYKQAVDTLTQSDKEITNLYNNLMSRSTIFDITERQQYEAKIHELAYHDVLTRLPNRQLLMDRINQSLARTARSGLLLAVMFLDLDKFKNINDRLGHDVGDELLKTVAVRLSASVRDSDTVSRSGGDEFIIVLPEINEPRDAELIAKKILERVGSVIYVKGYQLEVSISIGIAFYPSDGEGALELMKKADMAMYVAKEAGRNQYHF